MPQSLYPVTREPHPPYRESGMTKILAVLLLMSLLMAVTAVLPALLWSGMTALICTYAARGLLVQYGVLPAPVTEIPIPDEQFRIGI